MRPPCLPTHGPVLVNLGCGSRTHPSWVNLDLAPAAAGTIRHDLAKGIPLPDACCEVVYHSHLLEHLSHSEARALLAECRRVLKPQGLVRVVTPDLEEICRLYLKTMERAKAGDRAAALDYKWMLLEMYDQAVREHAGGEMLEYLRQMPLPNEAFVYSRIGEEGRSIVQGAREQNSADRESRLRRWLRGRNRARRLSMHARCALRSLVEKCLLDQHSRLALQAGRFRHSGEVHRWMYDEYSLGRMLLECGFEQVARTSATSSSVPGWTSFNLDTLPDGAIRKPDSLFMEARKPA